VRTAARLGESDSIVLRVDGLQDCPRARVCIGISARRHAVEVPAQRLDGIALALDLAPGAHAASPKERNGRTPPLERVLKKE
jgi:hypothetical protein